LSNEEAYPPVKKRLVNKTLTFFVHETTWVQKIQETFFEESGGSE